MKKVSTLMIVFLSFLVTPQDSFSAGNKKYSPPKDLDLMSVWQAWEIIKNGYVDDKKIDNETITRGLIKGMIYAVGDKHGYFFKTDDFKKFISATHSGVNGKIINEKNKNGRPIKIAHLKINSFTETTDDEMRSELEKLIENGTDRLILDLRNNPGGMLEASVDVCGTFLGPDKVVFVKSGRQNKEEITSVGEKTFGDIPIICLIGKSSASAAEIVAGALQDHHRAKLVGQTSYGKGTIQTSFETSAGIIVITTKHWVTPNGNIVEGQGLKPDVEVKNVSDTLAEAVKIIRDM